MGISILTYTKSIGPVTIDPCHFDATQISQNPVAMPDAHAVKEAQTFWIAALHNKILRWYY